MCLQAKQPKTDAIELWGKCLAQSLLSLFQRAGSKVMLSETQALPLDRMLLSTCSHSKLC